MKLNFVTINSLPEGELLTGIVELHKKIFGVDTKLISKLTNKPKLLTIVAFNGTNVVGYKIGYEIDSNTFYSWLGGVDQYYRKQGIASILMKNQHQFLKEEGYRTVQTKTMNKWRSMLILNIKNGFDVVNTQIDSQGIHKILLEKKL
ncbi:GNAT family N-acetyltransferase [Rummeliibacillus pycnus]|uniref:GNAT family N-acetyltransferase n=1 Tax=Rummeliibacillus pycnus TaxID=101070 RepID=UPI0037CA2528